MNSDNSVGQFRQMVRVEWRQLKFGQGVESRKVKVPSSLFEQAGLALFHELGGHCVEGFAWELLTGAEMK